MSGYHVRVALGQVVTIGGHAHDHAWVMYKSEAGRWTLLEPLLSMAPKPKRPRARGKPRQLQPARSLRQRLHRPKLELGRRS
ncbi:MAG: hypothetical protein ACHQ53_18990, partial [Polyangiales bacterium]